MVVCFSARCSDWDSTSQLADTQTSVSGLQERSTNAMIHGEASEGVIAEPESKGRFDNKQVASRKRPNCRRRESGMETGRCGFRILNAFSNIGAESGPVRG